MLLPGYTGKSTNSGYILMRRYFVLLSLMSLAGIAFAQTSASIRSYIERFKEIALRHEREYGIPATITLAQGILESGAGESGLARNANNHFGIKADRSWSGGVYRAWDDETVKSRFRVYSSAEESYEDHARFLKAMPRYRSLFAKSLYDYRGWAYGLQQVGYATSPTYAKALVGYIDAYQLYAVNGGVKVTPGRTVVITKTTTREELVERKDLQMEEDEKSEEEEYVEAAIRRHIIDINGVRCTIIYPGESLASVAMKYDISIKELMAFNEISSEEDLQEGDVVFLDKKRKAYHGPQEYYRVKEDDTLYQIAQQFGIRLSSLARMNRMDLFTRLRVGEQLRLK